MENKDLKGKSLLSDRALNNSWRFPEMKSYDSEKVGSVSITEKIHL